MIVFTKGGDERQMPVFAAICGLPLEEVVLDVRDFAALAQASDAQLREWVNNLHTRFIPQRGHTDDP